MTERLRLTRDPQESAPGEKVIPFPAEAVRERLVAGRVNSNPTAEAPPYGQEQQAPNLRLHTEDGDAPLSTPALIHQIEKTLDRMQKRLNRVREQVDDALKFPEPEGDTWPPRAA